MLLGMPSSPWFGHSRSSTLMARRGATKIPRYACVSSDGPSASVHSWYLQSEPQRTIPSLAECSKHPLPNQSLPHDQHVRDKL